MLDLMGFSLNVAQRNIDKLTRKKACGRFHHFSLIEAIKD